MHNDLYSHTGNTGCPGTPYWTQYTGWPAACYKLRTPAAESSGACSVNLQHLSNLQGGKYTLSLNNDGQYQLVPIDPIIFDSINQLNSAKSDATSTANTNTISDGEYSDTSDSGHSNESFHTQNKRRRSNSKSSSKSSTSGRTPKTSNRFSVLNTINECEMGEIHPPPTPAPQ